jgi:hypothetical protein
MRDSFIFYTAYAEKFKKLSDEQMGKLIRMIAEYQESGEVPEVDDMAVSLSFDVIKVDMDRNNVKYEETCEKRREAGAKGGQASASKRKQMLPNATKCKQTQANQADNDNDNDNDNVTFKKSNKINIRKNAYVEDEGVNKAIMDFIDHRKKLRSPMTDRAIQLFINKLQGLESSPAGQIRLINTAIERGWKTVYPSNDSKPIQREESSDNLNKLADRWLEEINQ